MESFAMDTLSLYMLAGLIRPTAIVYMACRVVVFPVIYTAWLCFTGSWVMLKSLASIALGFRGKGPKFNYLCLDPCDYKPVFYAVFSLCFCGYCKDYGAKPLILDVAC